MLAWLAASAVWGQQVLLRVRFAQVDAAAERLMAPSLAPTAHSDIRALRPAVDLVTFLEDLRARGAGIRMLAEPALLAPATLRFGTSLELQPSLHKNAIRMLVKPSVPGLNPTRIAAPKIEIRSTEAEVEMMPSQSIVIGGLLNESAKSFLNNLPQTGTLDAILKNGLQPNTKLVVIVTPEIL